MTQRNVFLGIPNNHTMCNETWQSVLEAGREDTKVYSWRSQSSLLANNFNGCVVTCLKAGKFDYYCQIHSDIEASRSFVAVLIDELEKHNLDAIHAVVPIKHNAGMTSTAVAYSDDEWDVVRRITMKELAKLPTTFDIETLKEVYDPNAIRLLPNTGCLLMRVDDWLKDFPGFEILDKIVRNEEGGWDDKVVPEDWNFGHWAARNGVKVGGTKAVKITHWGRQGYPNNEQWGEETDSHWLSKKAALHESSF